MWFNFAFHPLECIALGIRQSEATARWASIEATNWPPELHPLHHLCRKGHVWTAVWEKIHWDECFKMGKTYLKVFSPFVPCLPQARIRGRISKKSSHSSLCWKDPTHVWQSWSTSRWAACWPACPRSWSGRREGKGEATRPRGKHLSHEKLISVVYFLATVLLGMRHALEDQETDGRVVVEQVSVGGQVVSNCQPTCLVFTMDHIWIP